MSSFLSNKFLKYRKPAAQRPIERDLFCTGCGYNLRGLTTGRSCPECGKAIEPSTVITDVLLSSDESQRSRWQLGLLLASLCIFIALGARWVFFGGGFTGVSDALLMAYLGIGSFLSGIWAVAVWMITPVTLQRHWPWMKPLRRAVRVAALLFPLAYAQLWWRDFGNLNSQAMVDVLSTTNVMCRALGGFGALGLGVMMMLVAQSAELETAAKRLNLAVWLLPIFTILGQVFPSAIPWFFLVPLGMILVGWTWPMLLFALALLEMHRHVRWAQQLAIRNVGRESRLQATRGELNQRVEATIRPTGVSLNDVPLEPAPEGKPAQQAKPSR